MPKEYDSWARAPVSETGSLFSVEMKRRTTAGGGLLLAWWFAFFAFGDPRVIVWVALVRVGRDFLRRLGARAGESSLKRDSPHVQQLRFRIFSSCCALSPPSPLRPFAFAFLCSLPP
jgi:hypothetical protein